jgi:hypothetical protein
VNDVLALITYLQQNWRKPFNFNVAALATGGWKRVLRRGRTEMSSDRSDTSGVSVSPLLTF